MFAICNILIFCSIAHSQSDTYFTEVANSIGIDHYNKHNNFNGGGCAFFDSDNDGDDDIYLISGSRRDHLLINNNGVFEEASFFSGLGLTDNFYTTGVVTGDINNDGWEDIFVTTHGSGEILSKNILFVNKGNNEFEDAWLQFNEIEKTAGAILIDFDNDGLLDIYCMNYVEEPGFHVDTANVVIGYDHLCYRNTLYRNLGNLQFEDVSSTLINTDENNGCTLVALATDFDRDRDTDLLVGNDFGSDVAPNKLLDNINGGFFNYDQNFGFNDGIYSMGIASADLDHDLDIDYYITNFGANIFIENRLDVLQSSEHPIASSSLNSENENELSISWGAVFLDYNNDKNLDLYVANGYVPAPNFLPSSSIDEDRFYEGSGGINFEEPNQSKSGLSNSNSGRGVAVSDFDNDGDQDLLVNILRVPTNGEMKSQFYRNNLKSTDSTHWVQLKLEGLISNKSACGANVELYSNDFHTLKELTCGNSHGSSSSKTLHFGLGELTRIDSLKIYWPNSEQSIDTYYDLKIDTLHFIQEDTTFLITETETETDTIDLVDEGGIIQLLTPKKHIGKVIYRSIKKQDDVTSFNVYPNPITNETTLNLKSKLPVTGLRLTDSMGRAIISSDWQSSLAKSSNGEFHYTLDLSELITGIYLLQVSTLDNEYLEKIIIH